MSLVGPLAWPNPTVYADPATAYDWRFLAGLNAFIVVRPGINARAAICGIYSVLLTSGIGYPMLVDVENQQAACVVSASPITLWQLRRDSSMWKEIFEWN